MSSEKLTFQKINQFSIVSNECMSEANIKRTLHRSVAILLLPLSLLLIQVEIITRNLTAVIESSVPGFSRVIGLALFVVAISYLVISGLGQLSAAADTPF